MKKVCCFIIVFICFFSFIGVVNAEESNDWSSLKEHITDNEEYNGEIVEVIKSLVMYGKSSNSLEPDYEYNSSYEQYYEDFLSKYDIYYIMLPIEHSENYDEYVKSCKDSTVNMDILQPVSEEGLALISTINSIDDLNSWTKISLSDFNNTSGVLKDEYVFGFAVVEKENTSTIYVDRSTYLGCTLYANDTNTNTSTSVNQTVMTSTNPNTGLSDFSIYFVVGILIVGSTIVLVRKYS